VRLGRSPHQSAVVQYVLLCARIEIGVEGDRFINLASKIFTLSVKPLSFGQIEYAAGAILVGYSLRFIIVKIHVVIVGLGQFKDLPRYFFADCLCPTYPGRLSVPVVGAAMTQVAHIFKFLLPNCLDLINFTNRSPAL